MIISHRIELVPNKVQLDYLVNSAGCARFAYNWALSEWKKQYDENKTLPEGQKHKINEGELRKQLNKIKREKYPFLLDVSKYASQEAVRQLGIAFKNFFTGKSKHPRYRQKFVDDRFTLGNDVVKTINKKVQLPKIGWMKMRESIRFKGKIKTVSISCSANRWFISFSIECDNHKDDFKQHADNQGEVIGLDMGSTNLAILSTGERFENPKSYRKNLKKLKQLQRALSRKIKGSKNRQRAKLRVAKQHHRIANIRKDALHKLTAYVTDKYKIIGIENLNIKGMLKNRHLSMSVADASWYELTRQLIYKAKLKNGYIVKAPKFYASSKLCSCCGWKNEKLKLSDRVWSCHNCGTTHDRDINAAQNLCNIAVSSTVKASGEVSSGFVNSKVNKVKLTSVKDEFNL